MNAAPLARFFARLDRLVRKGRCSPDSRDASSGQPGDRHVRIAHFGDSHTAADMLPSTIRRQLQDRFGDSGRGFSLIGKPWPAFRLIDGVTDASGVWHTRRVVYTKQGEADGRYGLGGVAIESRQRGATVTFGTSRRTRYCDRATLAEIYYLRQPDGGSFSVSVDGVPVARIRTRSNRYKSGFKSLALSDGPHRIELRLRGDGKVRIFGAALERTEAGVSYDVMGINGAFFYTPLRWDGPVLRDQMRRRNPHLVIMMYGANEADARYLEQREYRRRVLGSMTRLLKDASDADCLVLGPMDRELYRYPEEKTRRLDLIIGVQRSAAEEKGCGFIDLRDLMGGPDSIARWKEAGLAQSDGVHLTSAGYRLLGKMVTAELMAAWGRSESRQERAATPRSLSRR